MKLKELYTQGKGKERYPQPVFKAFFKRINLIESAKDERDLRALRSVHFEKLKTRPGLYSMRLEQQYRLEISFEKIETGEKIIWVEKITKHYKE